MKNQDRVLINNPEITLVFEFEEITAEVYRERMGSNNPKMLNVILTKELAEKYSAQLRKALMDLDRTS